MYRLALLNLNESPTETEKAVNTKALNACVETLEMIIDHHQELSPVCRQMVGVFLKELWYESKKKTKDAEEAATANSDKSPAEA
ncbi:hypothetical protein NMY22_g17041 [Coprinellus aureogranulatus]|nr:hypothetical protein NMY22_g17041 [Coprinellus aureogranulatus]